MDDKDYTKASSRWLLEMNFLNNGYVKNAIYANVYNASSYIVDAELLVDQYNKRMLIYLKLSFFGRLFRKEDDVDREVITVLKDALPEYEMRVIYDKNLFQKATEMLNPSSPVSSEALKTEEPQEETAKEETPQEDAEEKGS